MTAKQPTLFGASSSAVISDCGTYRYSLTRQWNDNGLRLLWIMLNPSTADADIDDPTLRRVTAFSKEWGYGSLMVVNLFALRSPNPIDIWGHSSPVGENNDDYIRAAIAEADGVIVAWGKGGSAFGVGAEPTRDRVAMAMLAEAGVTPCCLGTNKNGTPKHPLYLAASTDLQPYTTHSQEAL